MRVISSALSASAAVLALIGLATAQDSTQGHDMASMSAAMELPEACQTGEAPSMPGMEDMQSAMEGMGEHQKAFMEGMVQTQGPMMQGMMAEDPDVALACTMSPHHQAAISMAEVELQQGDNDQMKAVAQKVIDAQKQEIAELTKWLEEQGQ